MRVLLMAIFLTSLFAGLHAEPERTATADCFVRADQDKRIGDSIAVLTDDSVVIRGNHPVFNATSSILYMRQITDTGATSHITIPYDRINRISYRKPSGVRWILTVTGYCIGAVAGGMTGASLEGDGWDKIGAASMGGLIGGVIGAVAGRNIGKRFTTEVTLECR